MFVWLVIFTHSFTHPLTHLYTLTDAGIRKRDSLESVIARHQQSIAEYSKTEKDYNAVMKNIQDLTDDLVLRRKKWSVALKNNSNKVRKQFKFYLKKKGWTGSVDFNHKDKELKLMVSE